MKHAKTSKPSGAVRALRIVRPETRWAITPRGRAHQEQANREEAMTDLHRLSHSRALHLRDAVGALFPLTPAECSRARPNGVKMRELRSRLWRRDQRYGFVLCHWCRRALTRDQATKDHVRARCFGGPDSLSNLVLACEPCNFRRSLEQKRLVEDLRVEWFVAELRALTSAELGGGDQ